MRNATVRLSAVSEPAAPVQSQRVTNGRFDFEDVRPGRYVIRVRAPSYRDASLTIAAQATVRPLRIALEPTTPMLIGSVTGRARTPFNETPASQRVFPREAYRDQAQTSLSTVLDQTPGAFTTRDVNVNAGVPVAPSVPTVRAGLPFETSFQLDGANAALPSSGSFDLSLIPTFVVGDVEVLRGPGDVSAAGGSVGGGLNIRTAEPTAATRLLPEIEGDTTGGQFADLSYDGTLPGGKVSFASMFSVDGAPGASDGVGYGIGGACCSSLQGYELRRAMLLDLRVTPNPQWTFAGTMVAVNLDRALAATEGAASTGGDAVSLAPSLDATQANRFRFERFTAQYGAGDDTVSASIDALALARSVTAQTFGSDAYDSRAGGELSWSHAVAKNRYSLALDADGGNARSNDAYALPIEDGTAMAEVRVRGAAQLVPSDADRIDLAYEQSAYAARSAPFGGALSDRTWSFANVRAGYARTLLAGLSLRVSAGYGAVPPPLSVLSGSGVHRLAFVGLPARDVAQFSQVDDLERTGGFDLGAEWRLHGDTTTVSADLYRSWTHDAYMQQTSALGAGPVPAMLATWISAPNMLDEGAEVSIAQFKRVGLGFIAQLSLPRTFVNGTPSAPFYAAGNRAVLPGQNLAGGAFFAPGLNDVAPIRVPYAQGYGELSYKWPRGSRASIGVLYLGANNAYGQRAFATLNANLEISAGSRGKLQFSAENLTAALDRALPLLGGGVPVPLAFGGTGATNGNVLAPRTLRFMYRQSFGGAAIFEK